MSVPNFNDTGLLPAGVHDVTTEQAALLLARNACRRRLWASFHDLHDEAKHLPFFVESLIIDSAFATDFESPEFITVGVVVHKQTTDAAWASLCEKITDWNARFDPPLQLRFHFFGDCTQAFFDAMTQIDPVELGQGLVQFPTLRKGLLRIQVPQ